MPKPTRISWFRPGSGWPIDSSSSRASSSGRSVSSDSIFASMKTASAGATSARSSSRKPSLASSASSTLKTYRNGLAVNRCSSRSSATSMPALSAPAYSVVPPSSSARAAVAAATRRGAVLAEPRLLLQPGQRLVDGLQVGEHQLGVDRLDVVARRDLAVDVHHVRVGEGPHHLADRAGVADVGEERVAAALPLRRAPHQTGDVDERHRRRDDLLRAEDLGELVQAAASGRPTTPTLGSIVANG